VSPVQHYKEFEKKVASGMKKGILTFFRNIGAFFKKLVQLGKQHFTVMFIPHNESRIINLKVNLFLIAVLMLLGIGLVGALLFYTFHYFPNQQNYLAMERNYQINQSRIELFQDNVNELGPVLRAFEDAFSKTVDVLGVDTSSSPLVDSQRRGDLGQLVRFAEIEAGTPQEIGQIQALRSILEGSIDPLLDISRVMEAQKNLLVDIPTLWPLKGGVGWPTFYFGPAVHPIYGRWYMHRGLDLAARRGTPILATANGKVIRAENHQSYGNMVQVQHKYGFSTLYAHMDRIYVTKGQGVTQGDVIGALGNTGVSTGPHLHYEVQIGTQLVDPAKYLNITNTVVGR